MKGMSNTFSAVEGYPRKARIATIRAQLAVHKAHLGPLRVAKTVIVLVATVGGSLIWNSLLLRDWSLWSLSEAVVTAIAQIVTLLRYGLHLIKVLLKVSQTSVSWYRKQKATGRDKILVLLHPGIIVWICRRKEPSQLFYQDLVPPHHLLREDPFIGLRSREISVMHFVYRRPSRPRISLHLHP